MKYSFSHLISVLLVLMPLQNVASQVSVERSRVDVPIRHKGVRRVVNYDLTSSQVPADFDGVCVAFLTDLHYKSRLDSVGLKSVSGLLQFLKPDIVLFGGDYQESCESVGPLVEACTVWRAPLGMAGVMGNNDYERCTDIIRSTFEQSGVKILEGSNMSIRRGDSEIFIAGARNDFSSREKAPSSTIQLPDTAFVILLTHTPDYAEDVDISNADVVLAGHTHGGQVTLFGLFAPVNPSHYGRKFLRGLCYNGTGVPVIVSRGLGTSRKKIRLFAPSEIVLLTLHWRSEETL